MSAYFSGSLVEQYGSTTVFVLTAVFPLIVSASALLIDEQRIPARRQAAAAAAGAPAGDLAQWQQPKQQQRQEQLAIRNASSSSVGSSWSSGLVQQLVHQGGALWVAVKQKHILLPTVFVFLWQVRAWPTGFVQQRSHVPHIADASYRVDGSISTHMWLVSYYSISLASFCRCTCTHGAQWQAASRMRLRHTVCVLVPRRRRLQLTLPCFTSIPMSSISLQSSWAGCGWQGPLQV